MLYMKTFILEEVTSTLLFDEIRKKSNQEEERSDLMVTERKNKGRRKKRFGLVKGVIFVIGKVIGKNDCKHRQE